MSGTKASRREFLRLMVVGGSTAAAASWLAACAPKVEPAASEAPKPAATKVAAPAVKAGPETITLHVAVGGGFDGVLETQYAKEYMEMHPEIDIKLDDTAQLTTSTALAVASGTLADILFAHNRWQALGCYKDWYLPIGDLLSSHPNAIPDYDDFYATAIESCKFEGVQYGIPKAVWPGSAVAVIMNRNIFADAGVEMPTGEVEIYRLQEIAFQIANKEKGVYGIQMVTHKQGRIGNTLRNWGKPEYGENGDTSGWVSSPDGKKWNWYDSPVVTEFYNQWYRPLLEAEAAVKPQDETDSAGQGELFVIGKVGMLQGFHRDPQKSWLKIGDKWEFHREDTCLIKGPEGRFGTCSESYNKLIGVQTEHPVESLELIGYQTSYESQLVALEETGYIAARHSAFRDTPLAKIVPLYTAVDQLLDSDRVEPYTLPWNLRDNEARDVYYNNTLPLYNCTATWEEQAPIVQKEMQAVYDLPRP